MRSAFTPRRLITAGAILILFYLFTVLFLSLGGHQ